MHEIRLGLLILKGPKKVLYTDHYLISVQKTSKEQFNVQRRSPSTMALRSHLLWRALGILNISTLILANEATEQKTKQYVCIGVCVIHQPTGSLE